MIGKYLTAVLNLIVGGGSLCATVFWVRGHWDTPLTLGALVLLVLGCIFSLFPTWVGMTLWEELSKQRKAGKLSHL